MLASFLLVGATARPGVTLMTALPLVWGEGDAVDIMQGRSSRSETLTRIDAVFDVRPIDVISAKTLGRNIAIIAQPRRLTPTELVALDTWIRSGGRAMIFADPELFWPSRYAPGDNRRAPPVELLDPLFTHWGIALGDSDQRERTIALRGQSVTMLGAGAWRARENCTAELPEVLACRIGKGRVILVGDADLLDPRLWLASDTDNPAWVIDQLRELSGAQAPRTSPQPLVIGSVVGAIIVAAAFFYYRFRRT